MSEVVERVARAIAETFIEDARPLDAKAYAYRYQACCAIAALRDCTPAMIEAGCSSHPDKPYGAHTTLVDIIEAEWRAMIDAALK